MMPASTKFSDAGRIVPTSESFVARRSDRYSAAGSSVAAPRWAITALAASIMLHVGLWAIFNRFDLTLVTNPKFIEIPIDLVAAPPPEPTPPQQKLPDTQAKGAESDKPAAKLEPAKPAEAPKTEAPKVDIPKPEETKPETPKAEAPKAEAPKPEQPRSEAPKPETPKSEPPKSEQPKPEPPKIEAQKPEPPKVEPPKPESPKPEPPKAEAQKPAPPKPAPQKPEMRRADLQKPARSEAHKPPRAEPPKPVTASRATVAPPQPQLQPPPQAQQMPQQQPAHAPEQPQPQGADALAAANIPNLPASPLQLGGSPETYRAVALPSSADDGEDPVTYDRLVFSRLELAKHFPEAAFARGARGSAGIGFTLDDQGNVLDVELLVPSGDPDLDEESVALVRRAAPFPPPPPGAQHRFDAVVTFDRRFMPQPN